jgi:hypothetical protein
MPRFADFLSCPRSKILSGVGAVPVAVITAAAGKLM